MTTLDVARLATIVTGVALALLLLSCAVRTHHRFVRAIVATVVITEAFIASIEIASIGHPARHWWTLPWLLTINASAAIAYAVWIREHADPIARASSASDLVHMFPEPPHADPDP